MPASRVVHRRERYHPTSNTLTVGARRVAKSHGEVTLDRQMNKSSQLVLIGKASLARH